MKGYQQKKRPTFRLPGGDDVKKNVISGILMIIGLFVLVILISKSSVVGGERLSEYREKHPVVSKETMENQETDSNEQDSVEKNQGTSTEKQNKTVVK